MIIALQSLIYYYFRASLLRILNRLIQPYYKSLTFNQDAEDEEPEEQVFAEYDDEKGVVFYPPVYAQRYAAVSDCLMDERWSQELDTVVDLGFHDISFIKYLKEVPGIKSIIGVDIESIPLRCSSDLIAGDNYVPKKDNHIKIRLFQGNAADPDYHLIGADAVIAIEMIEHMLPQDLERLVHTIFGFIKPRIAVITTPNGDFNVLFKALERNGLRRLDHYFEWSREQFHDWCTNIVRRYPDYSVTCKGIGPGPEGTDHLGCCSQLALFVCKDYHKQQELTLDSLALVSKVPSPDNLEDFLNSCDSQEDLPEVTNSDSFSNLSPIQSDVTLTLSPPYCYNTFGQSDKVAQCNLDRDVGRSYLMDEDQTGLYVLPARRRVNYRVYDMEDLACRLNCTTLKVKKFSKSTQRLMAKNKIDSLVHTRDVVTQITHLTRMLNLKDRRCQFDDEHIWNNINWGDNAPYWNQYYKLVREYDYPFQEKPKDCIILELLTDEIHRLIDMQFDEELSISESKMEIPHEYLMKAVNHLTDDVDKVKELLEWNGYEVSGGALRYARQLPDDASDGSSERWRDSEHYSEGDATDVEMMTSDGSKVLASDHSRLRRALEQKIRKLHSTAADEDITSELERVVCQLMKLALKSSRGRSRPPPSWWLLCKLYDLLSLTERAIERRRMHFLRSYQICDITDDDVRSIDTTSALNRLKEDTTAQQILDKYNYLVEAPVDNDMDIAENYDEMNFDIDNISTVSSVGYAKAYQFTRDSPTRQIEMITHKEIIENPLDIEDEHLARTKAWVDDDVTNTQLNSSHSAVTNAEGNNTKVPKIKTKKGKKTNASKLWKKSHSKLKCSNSFVYDDDGLKVTNYEYDFGREQDLKEFSDDQHKSKPIPDEMMALRETSSKNESMDKIIDYTDDSKQHERTETISATEESFVIDIITDEYREKVALRRSVGTEPEFDESDIETLVAGVNAINEPVWMKHTFSKAAIQSPQPLYLYDINEPSTSKGIRHHKADVQCGPDTIELIHYPSPKVSNICGAGVKIGDSLKNLLTASKNSADFGTNTHDRNDRVLSPRNEPVGIVIKYSDHNLKHSDTEDAERMEQETTFLKPVSSTLNTGDSLREFCSSCGSPTRTLSPSPNASKAIETEQRHLSPTNDDKPKLSCGAIHVHSYKEKNVREDVIYQGEWQHNKPKPRPLKRPVNLIKKKSELTVKRNSMRSKEKFAVKRPTQSCDTSPSKKPPLTFAELMVKVNQDIAKKAEQGKKLRGSDDKQIAKKKSSPTSNIPRVCIVSKRVTSKSSLIMRKDSKSKIQLRTRSRVPLPKKPMAKVLVSSKARPIETTVAAINKNTLDDKAITEELKKDLFKSSVSPTRNISYVVYRSEVTTTSNETACTSPVSVKTLERRIPSPEINSSCSSRNSVATVKALNIHATDSSPCRRYDNKPPETEASTSKQKKYTKKAKAIDDKENTSMSSANSNLSANEVERLNKTSFTGKSKNVYVAKMNAENAKIQPPGNSVLSKPVNQAENNPSMNIPTVVKEERIKSQKTIPVGSQRHKENNIIKEITKKIKEANVVIVTSTPKKKKFAPVAELDIIEQEIRPVDNIHDDNDDLKHEIQRIVEESLNFISTEDDSKTLTEGENDKLEKNSSNTTKIQNSGHTLVRNFDATLGKDSIVSLADTVLTLTDTDIMSFKSMTSEYFLADTELEEQATKVSSVKDIFERKDLLNIQIPPNVNPIAMQAFSGISLGAEPLVGDRPDNINLQDSETGSFAVPFNRQVTSEEVFISGHSSGSFESCWMEEGSSVVPDWLFRAMNQPLNNDDDDTVPTPLPIEMPPPNDEQSYDENGNSDAALGAGTGAGDGCGMHSDYSGSSEDSDDSSLPSSEDTSVAQSETILVDPTAIAASYEAFRDAVSSSTLRIEPELNEATGVLRERPETVPPRHPRIPLANSGFEADVSSLDDTPDVPLAPAAPPTDWA